MASNRGRHSRNWKTARQHIINTQHRCHICGKPVDKTLSGNHPLGPTIDHITPLETLNIDAQQDLATNGLTNLALAHRRCNEQKGTSNGQTQTQTNGGTSNGGGTNSRNW